MASNLEGTGSAELRDALAQLESNEALREHDLRRFGHGENVNDGNNGDDDDDDDDNDNSDPPPPYRTLDSPSRNPTEPEGLESPPEIEIPQTEEETAAAQEAARRQARKDLEWALRNADRSASRPCEQFDAHAFQLALRIAEARHDPWEDARHGFSTADFEFGQLSPDDQRLKAQGCLEEAKAVLRARWQAQGIWPDAWAEGRPGVGNLWAHETEPASASASASASAPSRPLQQFFAQITTERDLLLNLIPDLDLPKPKKPFDLFPRGHFLFNDKSALYYHQLDRYRKQTRYNKKHRQALKEKKQKKRRRQNQDQGQDQNQSGDKQDQPDLSLPANPDIDSQAYENIRTLWKKIGIWDTRWTFLPGLQWPHEEPFNDYLKRHLVEEGFAEEMVNEEEEGEESEEEDEDSDDEEEDDEDEGDKEEARAETTAAGSGRFLFGTPPLFIPRPSSHDDDGDNVEHEHDADKEEPSSGRFRPPRPGDGPLPHGPGPFGLFGPHSSSHSRGEKDNGYDNQYDSRDGPDADESGGDLGDNAEQSRDQGSGDAEMNAVNPSVGAVEDTGDVEETNKVAQEAPEAGDAEETDAPPQTNGDENNGRPRKSRKRRSLAQEEEDQNEQQGEREGEDRQEQEEPAGPSTPVRAAEDDDDASQQASKRRRLS